MTLCIGWVRKLHQTQEICLIADSCISGGQRFYSAPKIFPMMRGLCNCICRCDSILFPYSGTYHSCIGD